MKGTVAVGPYLFYLCYVILLLILSYVICGSSCKRRQTKCLLLKVNNFFVNGDILVFSRQVFPPFC